MPLPPRAVLVKFWAEYRDHPEFEPKVSHIVLKLVARSAQLIQSHPFTHGVRDTARCQILHCFKSPRRFRTGRKQCGKKRSRQAISEPSELLYQSRRGHASALRRLSQRQPVFWDCITAFHAQWVEIPEEWWTKYAKAVEFYALLRGPTEPCRCSVTLPAGQGFGPRTARNSTGAATPLTLQVWSLVDSFATYPVTGHAMVESRRTT
jgi:hypothetical protein